ncbi:MAG: hypothetical protein JW918_07790 [Anaerolineae bacterium]|nr:hypothetical protein [Anaerolineae bacterium]
MTTQQIISPSQVLECISSGKSTQSARVAGSLGVDPLVVSRWLCGEDMRGVYQPIVLRDCILDELDLEGCTFYETMQLTGCRIAAARFAAAYFYSWLLIENCVFEGPFEGQRVQNDGGVIIHNTVFAGWADFDGASLRGELDLVGVSFPSGTNLLYLLADKSATLGGRVRLSGCQFRAADIPPGLGAFLATLETPLSFASQT